MFKITSILTAFGLVVFAATPIAFADGGIEINNVTTANVNNNVSLSAETGANTALGGSGDNGGNGGNVVGPSNGDQIGGDGGFGGDGGRAGLVASGDAVSAASIQNDVSSTDIKVVNEADRFNKTIDSHSSDDFHDFHESITSVNEPISVSNNQFASINNNVTLSAETGHNLSQGGNGEDGGNGGDVNSVGNFEDHFGFQRGGDGGDGGWGGDSIGAASGDAESIADIVNVVGRTIIRVINI
jgi:hypothetical protein